MKAEHEAFQYSILPERLDRIIGARGMEPARAAQLRRQYKLVGAHQPDEEQARESDQKGKDAAHG